MGTDTTSTIYGEGAQRAEGTPAGVSEHMPGHKSLIHTFTDSASARQIHPAALPRPFFKGLHGWG